MLPCLLAAALLVAAPSPGETDEGPTDARVERAWSKLKPAQKLEVIEWFQAEVPWIGTFQAELLAHVLKDPEHDPFRWPEAGAAAVFEAAKHAPGAARRKSLSEKSSTVRRLRERFSEAVPERGLESAWIYDWVAREPRLIADPSDPERLFRNALRGYPPLVDYAEVLVLRALDDGSQQPAASAFGHAYADRSGRVFPGITLYDAWGSGTTFETPDVECLGIVHLLLDDWTTWRAPVPPGEHPRLYGTIEERFVAYKRHRGLRTALARSYLLGSAAQRDGYAGSLGVLHALWEGHSSDPAKLADILPDSGDWARWLDRMSETLPEDEDLWNRGQSRWATLDANGRAVRATLIRVMGEADAF